MSDHRGIGRANIKREQKSMNTAILRILCIAILLLPACSSPTGPSRECDTALPGPIIGSNGDTLRAEFDPSCPEGALR